MSKATGTSILPIRKEALTSKGLRPLMVAHSAWKRSRKFRFQIARRLGYVQNCIIFNV